MNRRKFLKTAAIAGLGITVPGSLNLLIPSLDAAEGTDLAVVQGSSPANTTRAAVEALGGIRRFIVKDDIVVVKPNIGWDRTPEYAANTNPEVVATLVALCYEAGAKKVKVFDNTCNDARRCYKQSGIADAAKAAGADVSFTEERKFRDVRIDGLSLKSWPLYGEILDADKIINVPIAKTHGRAILTLGMKNWMGIMGGSRGQIHQRLDENLVDLARVIKPTLTVLDAVRILTANGPQGGNLSDVKKLDTVIAGTDPVAVDAYGATLFGMKGSDLGFIRLADRAGLGTMNLAKLKIRKIRI
jgi:uncharacterized protein (DUF362 family)